MNRLRSLRSPIVAAVVAGAIVSIVLGVFTGATLAFAAVAAAASVAVVGLAWKSATEQRQMADDLRRLAELTENSIEEARAQRPDPVVRFLAAKGEAADAILIERTRLERAIDVEAIVEAERRRALATLPVEKPKRDASTTAALPGFEGLAEVAANAERLARFLGPAYNASAPATPEETAKFEKQVDDYIERLRSWLDDYSAWRDETDRLVRLRLRFENLGRVPCEGARIDVHFPDPFDEAEEEYPEMGTAPTRPRFHRRSALEIAGLGLGYTPHIPVSSLSPRILDNLERRNVSRPRYRKGGSIHVDFTVTKLLHGRWEDSDLITLRAPADGIYTVPWTIWGENLGEPARGQLQLHIATQIENGPAITGLEELLPKPSEGEDDSED